MGDTKLSSNPTGTFRLPAAAETCGVGGGSVLLLHLPFDVTAVASLVAAAAATAPVTVAVRDLDSGGDFIMVALLRELDLRTGLVAVCERGLVAVCERGLNADPDDNLGGGISAVPRRTEGPG